MSEQSDALADALPAGFYEQVAPFLHLCGMGCLQFFSRPDDPLPREITALTGLDLAAARMITAINSNAMLVRQLLEEPELFYVHLLVGCRVLAGPLATPVLLFLEQSMHLDAQQTVAIREHLLPFGETFVDLVGKFASHDDAEARADLHLLRLQIDGAFTRLAGTLQATDLPAVAPPHSAAEACEVDDEAIFAVEFRQEQLRMLRLALTLVRVLPSISELPFAQAVAQLSGCPAAVVAALEARLQTTEPAAQMPLSWPEVAVLYQSTQVLAMALVSNVQDVLRWDSHAGPADLAPDTGAAACAAELSDPEPVARRQEVICMMVTGFVECVHDNFTDDPRLTALRAEVTALADLL
ncbi:hypothetical protein LJ737_18575 [Hymenobacter sp. 15J16-1T3B]|uniref:hypothetical protein n=1 Tax=Hymenobacter sp. 15J16-1T3B TaxID=2886941 RepID=UPI001D115C02|nr:hypothetical protein [Hymenobacter sp. 15J16-1T3B]MCC3159254.1 hypothetical protein [Hymenobacter sp. 15J16-1T3B]